MKKNTYKITLSRGDHFIYDTQEDEKDIAQIQHALANDKCVIIGNTIYTVRLLVRIEKT